MISSSVCFFFSSSNSSVRSSPSSPRLNFFLVSVVVKEEKSSKRKKVAKFLTSFLLARPLLLLAKEEDGSTNIFAPSFSPSLSLSLSLRRTRPTTGRQTERERVKEIHVLLLAWLFLVFFLIFSLAREKILKYEYYTYDITSTKSLIIGIILMIIKTCITHILYDCPFALLAFVDEEAARRKEVVVLHYRNRVLEAMHGKTSIKSKYKDVFFHLFKGKTKHRRPEREKRIV